MESTTQERPASTFVAKIIEEEQEKAKTLLSSVFDNHRHPIFQAIETIQSLKLSIYTPCLRKGVLDKYLWTALKTDLRI